MNKIGILFLIIIALGAGYWLSMPKEKTLSEEEQKLANLLSNTPIQKIEEQIETQNNTQEQTQTSESEQNINNQGKNINIMNATLHTNKGDITIAFNPNTPKTVENFVKLAKEGFYNGTKFHRVIKDFMSQGGDPLSKDDSKKDSWGTGGPGYKFDDELSSDNKNNKGTISMANSGPNTNGSQFFINATDNNYLDTKHVVFAKIVDGLDVAEAINSVKTDSSDRPIDPIILESILLK